MSRFFEAMMASSFFAVFCQASVADALQFPGFLNSKTKKKKIVPKFQKKNFGRPI